MPLEFGQKELVAHFRPWWLMVLSLSLERVPEGRCEKHDQDIEGVKCIDIMISEKEGIEFYQNSLVKSSKELLKCPVN